MFGGFTFGQGYFGGVFSGLISVPGRASGRTSGMSAEGGVFGLSDADGESAPRTRIAGGARRTGAAQGDSTPVAGAE